MFLVFEKDTFKAFLVSNCKVLNLLCLVNIDIRGLGEVVFTISPSKHLDTCKTDIKKWWNQESSSSKCVGKNDHTPAGN